MKSVQVLQTLCLLILCAVGVMLSVQVSKIESRYHASDTAQTELMARAALLEARGEARIAANDRALGMEYLTSALAINGDDEALRTRLAELRAESILSSPTLVNAKNALSLHALFHEVMERNGETTPLAIRIAYGKTLTVRGRLDEAKIQLDEAVKIDAKSANALLFRADIHLAENKWDEALDLLERASKLDAENPLIQFGLGMALLNLKKYEAAETTLASAAQKLGSSEAWIKLGTTRAYLKKWKAATDAFERAEALQPNSAKMRAAYAVSLAQQGKTEAAIAVTAVRVQRTGDPNSYAQMGNWYLDLKKYESALEVFRTLRKENAEESEYECKFAQAWEQLKKLDKALHFYKKCKTKAQDVEGRKGVYAFAERRIAALSGDVETPAGQAPD